jgi:hypothetical protein
MHRYTYTYAYAYAYIYIYIKKSQEFVRAVKDLFVVKTLSRELTNSVYSHYSRYSTHSRTPLMLSTSSTSSTYYVCIYTYTYIYIHTHIYALHTYTHTHTCTYIACICIHAHTHTHTHTHTQPLKSLPTHTGVMRKRGRINTAYQDRFFVLADGTLQYYSSQRAYTKGLCACVLWVSFTFVVGVQQPARIQQGSVNDNTNSGVHNDLFNMTTTR